MSSILPLLLFVIFLACLAMAIREGLWSNALMFFNVLLAAILATNYFEPVADYFDQMLDAKEHSWRYFMDFAALWAVFARRSSSCGWPRTSSVECKFGSSCPSNGPAGYSLPAGSAGSWSASPPSRLTFRPLARNFLYGAFQDTLEIDILRAGAGPEWPAYMHTMSVDGFFRGPRPGGRSRPRDERVRSRGGFYPEIRGSACQL